MCMFIDLKKNIPALVDVDKWLTSRMLKSAIELLTRKNLHLFELMILETHESEENENGILK